MNGARTKTWQVLLAVAVLIGAPAAYAQPAGPAGSPPKSPREAAPIDLTGQWVAIVNEDWRWRMVTPPKGDYASVPLNDEGRRVADQWDPSQDGACEAYGAAALLRSKRARSTSVQRQRARRARCRDTPRRSGSRHRGQAAGPG
jgi:hypothetical protein